MKTNMFIFFLIHFCILDYDNTLAYIYTMFLVRILLNDEYCLKAAGPI